MSFFVPKPAWANMRGATPLEQEPEGQVSGDRRALVRAAGWGVSAGPPPGTHVVLVSPRAGTGQRERENVLWVEKALVLSVTGSVTLNRPTTSLSTNPIRFFICKMGTARPTGDGGYSFLLLVFPEHLRC